MPTPIAPPATLDDLKSWLLANGFTVSRNTFQGKFNNSDWYAYRKSKLDARECECNEGKRTQIVVYPHEYEGRMGVEVDLTGEYQVWWQMKAYGLSVPEFMERLPAIEASLIAAWNALSEGTNP